MKKTVNMFDSLKAPRARATSVRKSFVLPLVIILVAAGIGGLGVQQYLQGKRLDMRIAELNDYISGPAAQAVEEGKAALAKRLQYERYLLALSSTDVKLAGLVEFDSGILARIESVQPSHVSITSVAVQDRVVTLHCSTTDNTPPADYAAALDGLGIFSSVEYSGFAGAPETGYTFQVSCVLPSLTAFQDTLIDKLFDTLVEPTLEDGSGETISVSAAPGVVPGFAMLGGAPAQGGEDI